MYLLRALFSTKTATPGLRAGTSRQ